jgi:hypothetical protein
MNGIENEDSFEIPVSLHRISSSNFLSISGFPMKAD